MTHTLQGADIRGFYAALGIDVPGWAHTEASVHCFVDPDAHRRDDRNPSTSVNLEHGAYHCHGCGAHGGAYDAALALGLSPRSAIELMIRHGLTERRSDTRRRAMSDRTRRPARTPRRASRPQRPRVTDAQLQRWHRRLLTRADVLARLAATRGWSEQTIHALELGLDGSQITIPVRDQHGEIVSLLRYRPRPKPGEEKMRATVRSQRVLYPHPAAEPSRRVLLVEGEPDRIAAHSHRLPAIAVPGTDSWRAEWAPLFAGRDVLIALDADHEGRACARHISAQLREHARTVAAVDLAPDRADGYDLTDWLTSHPGGEQRTLEQLLEVSHHVPQETIR